jgi:hypothetical protein
VTASAVHTSSRLDTEPGGEVFVFHEHAPPPPPAAASPGPLTHRVRDIFDSAAHGSPLAPVRVSRSHHLCAALDLAFRRAPARRATPDTNRSATKGTE